MLVMAGALLLAASTAHAQSARRPRRPARAPSDRVRLVVNGSAQFAPGSFGQRFTLTRNVESAPVTTDLSLATGGVFEAGARLRVHRRLRIGVVGFVASATASGTLEAQLPHPFYFNQPRKVSGDLSGLTRKERGVHLELAVPLRVSSRNELILLGGPSYFAVDQALVTDLTYSDSYPYDTATLDDTSSTVAKKAGPGFNAGVELTRQVSRSARVALLGRYARGTVTLSAGDGNEAEVHAGGLQVGVGLRFAF
jgi:hypothetical protein